MPYIENLDEIKERLDPEQVLDLIQPGVPKKRRGNEIRTCCPVHGGDGEENFSLNIKTHKWHCFSRGCIGTDLLGLYAQSKKIDFVSATEELATRFGIPIKYKNDAGQKTKKTPPKVKPEAQKEEPTYTKKKDDTPSYKGEDVVRCWEGASSEGDDKYFKFKKLSPPPIARFGINLRGFDMPQIPYRDTEGRLMYVLCPKFDEEEEETIRYTYNVVESREDRQRAFALLGELKPSGEFYIGEGIATVQTAWEASGRLIPAVSFGSCSNMIHALDAIMSKYPEAKPIVLLDCGKEAEAETIAEKYPGATFRLPNFEGLPNPKNKKLTDFNDLISKCGQGLDEVRKQLTIEYKMHKKAEEPLKEETKETFYDKLAEVIRDKEFARRLEGRNYDSFEAEHRKLFSSGGLITGYKAIDDKLYFAKGDLVVVQAMSNHGKSSFMLQLASRFLREEKNKGKKPLCIFVTYESTPIAIEAKLLNLLSSESGEGAILRYVNSHDEKFRYPDKRDYQETIQSYNELLSQNGIVFLKGIPLEQIEPLIDLYKKQFPERTVILFLDYIQIIECGSKRSGWELMKEMAYGLEKIAIKKEIIIVTASQVNENRQAREGRDIYNAATTVIDIFNHSHENLNTNKETQGSFKAKVAGKSVCTFAAVKQKYGESFTLKDYFLFNGFFFEESNQDKYSEDW